MHQSLLDQPHLPPDQETGGREAWPAIPKGYPCGNVAWNFAGRGGPHEAQQRILGTASLAASGPRYVAPRLSCLVRLGISWTPPASLSLCNMPYRSDEHWLELKQSEPSSYEEAVKFDQWLRHSKTNPVRELLNGRPYLHSARRPLSSVIAERETQGLNSINHFNEECEGLCGV